MRKLIVLMLCGLLSGNLYANTAEVVRVDMDTDTVMCEDSTGNLWEFCGCDDWEIGDLCNLVMYNNNTSEITDDIIVCERKDW